MNYKIKFICAFIIFGLINSCNSPLDIPTPRKIISGSPRIEPNLAALSIEENGINKKTYYYRLKRVCEAIPEKAKPTGLPLPEKVSEPAFAEVTTAHTARDAVITVRFGRAEMAIRNGAEPSVIEAALRSLSRIC
jgi:hypothetical protein